ncbi:MAG: tRNA lysidine(34) synthetase TilS [Candidatus Methylopumilus sp.]|nr:tRNA lysidine(34) synthetase TilS [Candidatus Methylopumilus sp.]
MHSNLSALLKTALSALAPQAPVAVALSGGADSVALALVAAEHCASTPRPLYFFHVHHGLMSQADGWVAHLQTFSQELNIPLHVCHVQVDLAAGLGVEGAARDARYTALAQLCLEHDVAALLLAHHRQDQAETVLLRLLRGTGVSGLAAMRAEAQRGGMRLLRPWLEVERAELLAVAQAYEQRTGWAAVQDPSNTDPKYARGALRSALAPVLNTHWPAWCQTLVRHAKQASEANEVLAEVAALDLAAMDVKPEDQSFSLLAWRSLSAARQALVVRYWLQKQGVAMPGERRLADLLRQLRQLHALGHDRELLWQHGSVAVRCKQGRVVLSSG